MNSTIVYILVLFRRLKNAGQDRFFANLVCSLQHKGKSLSCSFTVWIDCHLEEMRKSIFCSLLIWKFKFNERFAWPKPLFCWIYSALSCLDQKKQTRRNNAKQAWNLQINCRKDTFYLQMSWCVHYKSDVLTQYRVFRYKISQQPCSYAAHA